MTSFPDEMVAAWLNRRDEVLQRSGEPAWSTLEDALRKIGQTGLAEDVKRKRFIPRLRRFTSGDNINPSTQTDSG
jgi:hypothetical protein